VVKEIHASILSRLGGGSGQKSISINSAPGEQAKPTKRNVRLNLWVPLTNYRACIYNANIIIPLQGEGCVKAFVDPDICIGCGVCETIAPNVFQLSDGGFAVVIVDEVPVGTEGDVRQAAEECPEGAISIFED
jgi:ferredoxin